MEEFWRYVWFYGSYLRNGLAYLLLRAGFLPLWAGYLRRRPIYLRSSESEEVAEFICQSE